MSEEELNQELSTDELKDVAGGKGSYTKCATGEHIDKLVQIESWSKKGKKFVDTDTGIVHLEDDAIQA